MRPLAPMPQLALPFALVGGAAGALCCGVLANPLFREHPAGDPLVAAVVTALVGAMLGVFLHRRCSERAVMWSTPGSTRVTLLLALLAGGVVSGAVVGVVSWSTARGAIGGASAGMLFGAAFYPVGAAVVAAARRAERARMGSWVAASDRRAVWAILGTSLAVATLLALPDWPVARHGAAPPPLVAALVLIGGAAAVCSALIGDLQLLRRLRALEVRRARFAELDEASGGEAERAGVVALDLGLGAGTLAEMARSGSAYRGHDRAVALLLGDVATARRTVRRTAAMAAGGLALCVAILALHAWATGTLALVLYHEQRCAQSEAGACVLAAEHHLRGEAPSSSPRVASELLFRGCALGDSQSCRRHGGLLGDEPAMQASPAEVDASLTAGCHAGDDASCRRRIERALAAEPWDRAALGRLVSLYDLACAAGEERACIELRVLVTMPDEETPVHELLLCLRGFAVECEVAADRLAPQLHRLRRPDVGLALRELACAHGLSWSCHLAGWSWLEAGRSHSSSFGLNAEARAVDLYTRACALGTAVSCCEAAYIRAHSVFGNRDAAQARALFQRAVDRDHEGIGACSILRNEPEVAGD